MRGGQEGKGARVLPGASGCSAGEWCCWAPTGIPRGEAVLRLGGPQAGMPRRHGDALVEDFQSLHGEGFNN